MIGAWRHLSFLGSFSPSLLYVCAARHCSSLRYSIVHEQDQYQKQVHHARLPEQKSHHGSCPIICDLSRPHIRSIAHLVDALPCVSLSVYQVYWSLLRKFPGPVLAAASGWYELYFDCILVGRMSGEIDRLHRIYGMPRLFKEAESGDMQLTSL